MTNEEKAREIIGGGCNQQGCSECGGSLSIAEGCVEFRHLKAMAEYKDSQPQIIEIFGRRVKVVNNTEDFDYCSMCAFSSKCQYIDVGSLCEDSLFNTNRHFVEVDEDGNEIK